MFKLYFSGDERVDWLVIESNLEPPPRIVLLTSPIGKCWGGWKGIPLEKIPRLTRWMDQEFKFNYYLAPELTDGKVGIAYYTAVI